MTCSQCFVNRTRWKVIINIFCPVLLLQNRVLAIGFRPVQEVRELRHLRQHEVRYGENQWSPPRRVNVSARDSAASWAALMNQAKRQRDGEKEEWSTIQKIREL